MKTTLLILTGLLIGCGENTPLNETTYRVALGSWQAPMCTGAMTLTPNTVPEPHGMPPAFVGSWNCGSYGTRASGTINPDNSLFFDLETTPGFLNRINGTLVGDAISGSITLNGRQVPFVADRK